MANYGKRMVPEDLLKLLKEIKDNGITADDLLALKNKKLYYHGLNIYKGSESAIEALVLNNDNTPINSINRLKAWVESITGTVIINVNGAITIEGNIYSTIAIIKQPANTYQIFYQGTNAVAHIDNVDLATYFTNCDDAVNRLI